MRRAAVLFLVLTGCAESRFMVDETALDGVPVAEQARQDPAPPVDTFWLQQAVEESTRPPPRPTRSISLGYIGDAPLTGGVMRDTPMQPENPQYVEQGAPCSCALRTPPTRPDE